MHELFKVKVCQSFSCIIFIGWYIIVFLKSTFIPILQFSSMDGASVLFERTHSIPLVLKKHLKGMVHHQFQEKYIQINPLAFKKHNIKGWYISVCSNSWRYTPPLITFFFKIEILTFCYHSLQMRMNAENAKCRTYYEQNIMQKPVPYVGTKCHRGHSLIIDFICILMY